MEWRRFGFILLIIVILFGVVVAIGKSQVPPIVIITSMFATTLAVATPLTLGALSGIYCERAGVVNIGIEGMMLAAAFFGWLASIYMNTIFGFAPMPSLIVGVIVAILTGGLFALLHAVLSITFRVDQIIGGTVVNILAIGITGFLNRQLFFEKGSIFGGNVPHAPGTLPIIHIPLLADLPIIGRIFEQKPIAILAVVLVFVTHYVLFYTRWGLRTRAVGEHPKAADTVGIHVYRMRYVNVIIGGLMAGLGGAYFTLESVPSFEPLMTNGRGFVSLAAMIFGNWSPFGAWSSALVFGASQALQINLQFFRSLIPEQWAFLQVSYVVGLIPYILTMLILTGIVGRTIPPAADGIPYEKPPKAKAPEEAAQPLTPAQETSEWVLEARGITKQFPGVLANDHVDFTLRKGEIHALLGENGAGKTTLMNILYGLYQPDSGQILVNGRLAHIHSPKDSIALGIGMVHQHFMLIPVFTVAENVMLGMETTRFTRLDRQRVAAQVRQLSHAYGLDVDPEAVVGDLPVGVQQRIEIVKTLYRNAQILILDEPTAVLTPQETEELFRIMRELTARGVSIIFITHKLKEVMAVADRITVMRNGRVVGTTTPAETDEARLAAMMVGREVILKVEKEPAQPKEEVLRVENLHVRDWRDLEAVRGVSFSVRAGEILGIAGVQGNGQTELVEALTGLRPYTQGRMWLDGKEVTHKPVRVITEAGAAHIPEDRQRHGLVLSYSVADNMILNSYYRAPFARRWVMQRAVIDAFARDLMQQFDVRAPSPFVAVSTLSGGNQQKVIVARELSHPNVRLVIANQPTRGLDVGSIEYIHRRIVEMRDRGIAVLLVSAELDEIMALSDRIAVMYRGQIVATVEAAKATREQLGLWMAGIHGEATGQP
jgi:ABC-type uncharacterized transport system ATPase subunit/ABC-type uncharacterized transport system permease subunit